jgi:hypothetical protein
MEDITNNVNEPFRAGLTSNALPEAESNTIADSSQTGVSSRSVLSATVAPISNDSKKKLKWFVIRAIYGKVQKGVDFLSDKHIETFAPSITKEKDVNGVRKKVTEYYLPNLFFAQSTEKQLQELVERNPEADYLRFYCRYYNEGGKRRRQIITIPQAQMKSFMKICEAKVEDIRICNEVIHKFDKGEHVRITAGPFTGVEGRVVRIYGQQRVGIIIDDILTAMTSYVPSAYLEKLDE